MHAYTHACSFYYICLCVCVCVCVCESLCVSVSVCVCVCVKRCISLHAYQWKLKGKSCLINNSQIISQIFLDTCSFCLMRSKHSL